MLKRDGKRPWAMISAASVAGAIATIVVIACIRPPRPAVIGFGYRSQPNAAGMATELTDSLSSVSGRPIRITAQAPASSSQPVTFVAAEVDHASRLASLEGIVGVVGNGGSREALLAAPIYNERHIPQIVPTGTSRRLRDVGAWTLTLAPNDSVEGDFVGRFVAQSLGARTVTLFYVLDEYGAGLRDGTISALQRLGVQLIDVVPVEATGTCADAAHNAYEANVRSAMRRGIPDVVVLATRQHESGCIIGAIHAKHPSVRFVAGDGLVVNPDFRQSAGAGADSVFVVAFWHQDRPDSLSRAFVRRYERRFHVAPRADEAMIYDAVMALAEAIRTVGPDRDKVRRYLVSLGHERPALAGVTGPITFPGSSDRLLMTRVGPTDLSVVRAP